MNSLRFVLGGRRNPVPVERNRLVQQTTRRGFRHILQAVILVWGFALLQMLVFEKVCNEGMRSATSLETQGLPNLSSLAELRERLAKFRLHAYEYLFAQETQKARAEQAVTNLVTQLQTELDHLKSFYTGTPGADKAAAVQLAFGEVDGTYQKIRRQLDKNFAGAMDVLDQELPAKIEALNRAVDDLSRYGYAYSGAKARATFNSFAEIKTQSIYLGVASMAVATGLLLFVSLAADKTQKKLDFALQQISQQEQKLHLQASTLEAAANSIVITDATGMIVWVNPAFTRLTGYGMEEVLGHKTSLLNSGHHPAEFFQNLWATITAGRVWHGELVNRRKDGSFYDEEMTITPLRRPDGVVEHYIAVKQDISERKQFVRELSRERDLMQSLMDHLPDYIYFKDTASRYSRINAALARHLQVAGPADAIGKSDADFFPADQARQKRADEARVFQTGESILNLEEKSDVAGTVCWVSTTKVPLRDARGQIVGLVGVSRDITQAKQAAIERQNMELQLRQAHKMESIGQLAAGIAHEINTPTQYVGDNVKFLKDAFDRFQAVLADHAVLVAALRRQHPDNAEFLRYEMVLQEKEIGYFRSQIDQVLTDTSEGIERISKIVRAMKEFSHPGGKEKTPANLNKAIESTVEVARNEWKFVAGVQLALSRELPPVPCFLGELNQVILNLVVNAAHAIADVVKTRREHKGVISISTTRIGEWVEVRVGDNGTGIPESHRNKIFEPFFTTKGVGKGTGQGLAQVYATIVKKHGGTVNFETETGKGTTFIIRLPLREDEPAPPAPVPSVTIRLAALA